MTTACIIVLSLIGTALLVCITQTIILNNNTLYNRFYNKESYKILKELNRTPIELFTVADKEFKRFEVDTHPDWHIYLFKRDNSYIAAVFDSKDCLAGSFYKKGSIKLANKLMQLL